MSTLYRRELSREIKNSKVSPMQARRFQKAINYIRKAPASVLLKSTNLRKIQVSGRDDIYLYRVDLQHRIVLSINGEEKIIYNIVDVSDIRTG